MTGHQDAAYRMKMARGFLEEARQDLDLGRWRSVVDNAQLAVENAAKAVLALVGPVGRTHNPAAELRQLLKEGLFAETCHDEVQQLVERAEMLGSDIHIRTDYGDEVGGRTPWELFGEADARKALSTAEEAIALAQAVIQKVT